MARPSTGFKPVGIAIPTHGRTGIVQGRRGSAVQRRTVLPGRPGKREETGGSLVMLPLRGNAQGGC